MGSKTMQEPQRVGFRTANGDTGLQGANMPQPQTQFEMPNMVGYMPNPMQGNPGMQPMGRPMPPMTGGGTPQIPQTYPGAMHSPTPGQPFPNEQNSLTPMLGNFNGRPMPGFNPQNGY